MKNILPKAIMAGLLSLAIVGVTVSGTAQEKKEKAKTEGAEKKKSDVYPYRGKVKATDSSAMTITMSGKEKDRVISVTSETKVTKEGKPATFGDVKSGEEIRGQVKRAGDKENALSVQMGPFPEVKKGEGKGEGKKKEEKK